MLLFDTKRPSKIAQSAKAKSGNYKVCKCLLLPAIMFGIFTSHFSFAQALAYDSGTSYECTQVSLQDIDESLLTKEERVALLDGALSDSIDQYSRCVASVQTQMSQGGAGAAGGGEGQSAGEVGGAGEAGEAGEAKNAAQASNSIAQSEAQSSQANGSQMGSTPVTNSSSSTTPVKRGIVKPKDNDSIICKLLFDEIQGAEGASREGLEKQYNEYKCGN